MAERLRDLERRVDHGPPYVGTKEIGLIPEVREVPRLSSGTRPSPCMSKWLLVW